MKKIHLTFALISIIAVTEANAISYKFKTVDVPGATQTWGSQINASGHVIGGYSDATSSQHGFIYNDGTLTILDVPGSFDTNPAGINSNGQVIGTYNDGDFFSPQNHGFTYSGGTFTSYDAPNSLDNTSFNKINDSGQIIGVTYLQESPERLAAFIYDNNNGNITHIGDFNPVSINFNGQVVAGYNPGFILYSNGQNLNLSVPNSSGYDNPTSINDSGQVVGSYYDINSTYHGFLYRDGRYTN